VGWIREVFHCESPPDRIRQCSQAKGSLGFKGMRKAGTTIIILATCLLALGPLCGEFIGRAGYARWLLAQSANELQRGQVDQAKATLARAFATSPEITSDADFWRLRFDFVSLHKTISDEDMDELQRDATNSLAMMDERLRVGVAETLATLFAQNKRLEQAIDILQTAFPQIQYRSAQINNDLAYFRAILKRDLDVALKEVDAALALEPGEAILDTKAWVLYRKGNFPAALPFANQAISQLYLTLKKAQGNPIFAMGPTKDLFEAFEPGPLERAAASQVKKETNEKDGDKQELNATVPQESNPTDDLKAAPGKKQTDIERVVSPLDAIKKDFKAIKPELLDELAKQIATMRFHRACILDALNRQTESEVDYEWLDRFGFSDTSRLF
jgi:tetratricopeptide (TPR) repeat protein